MPAIHIKSYVGNDVRRFSVDSSSSFSALHKKLVQIHNFVEVDEALEICYRDQEKDWITVSSDEELQNAFDSVKQEGKPEGTDFLRIRVRRKISPLTDVCNLAQTHCILRKAVFAFLLAIFLSKIFGCCLFFFLGLGALFFVPRILARGACGEKFVRGNCGRFARCGNPLAAASAPVSAPSQSNFTPSNPTVPAASENWHKFRENLEVLAEMGWSDQRKVVQALVQSNGDLSGAIQILVSA